MNRTNDAEYVDIEEESESKLEEMLKSNEADQINSKPQTGSSKNDGKGSHRHSRKNHETEEKTHRHSTRRHRTEENSQKQSKPKQDTDEMSLNNSASGNHTKKRSETEQNENKQSDVNLQSVKSSNRYNKNYSSTSKANSIRQHSHKNSHETDSKSRSVKSSMPIFENEEIKYFSSRQSSNSYMIEASINADFDDYNQKKYEQEKKIFAEYISEKSITFKSEDDYWDQKSKQLYDITSFEENNQPASIKQNSSSKRIFKIVSDTETKLPLRVAVITDNRILRIMYQDDPKSESYIEIKKCAKFFQQRRKKPGKLIKEFEKLKIIPNYTTEHSQQEKFAFRNRFPACIPFNYNRVKLCNLLINDTAEDYFNASYIMDTYGKVFCIASQSPIKEEVEEFWSMIYENHCTVILSLMDHDDPKNQLCKYWPNEEKNIKGSKFTVETILSTRSKGIITREIKITPKRTYSPLIVKHINYTSWQNYTDTPRIGEFVQLRSSIISCLQDPIDALPLIHCSSGSGRTAIMIAFCIAYNYLLRRDNFDVYELVHYLKKQRLYFFDTQEKYTFLNKLIEISAENLGLYDLKKKV